jgi:hypothetical protein
MTRNLFTATARRTVISALATVVFATAFPQAGFAYSSLDMWKVDPAKSSFNLGKASQSNVMTIDRKPSTEAAGDPSKLLVIADGKVYLATGEAAKDALAGKRIDPKRLVQIGRNARSTDYCGFECQEGFSERRRTLTFTTQGGQQASTVVASGGK